MDPTDEELTQIAQYQDALDWAGVEGELAAALQEAAGGVQRIREVPLITRAMWNQMTQDLRVPEDPDPAVMGPSGTCAPGVIETGVLVEDGTHSR